ncbi:MAG: hypothetical protein M3162_00270 [Thermoproteota archaeon]|nr:hypothetical protein [Thermoproteota archaeon]
MINLQIFYVPKLQEEQITEQINEFLDTGYKKRIISIQQTDNPVGEDTKTKFLVFYEEILDEDEEEGPDPDPQI